MGINTGWGGSGGGGPITVGDITATGTPSASTYLRGDGAWAAVGGFTPTYCRYTGHAGFGSTNTYVTRWTTATTACTGNITYSASAANGDYWEVSEAGVYTVSVGWYGAASTDMFVHSAAAVVNTIAYDAVSLKRMIISHTSYPTEMNWTGYLPANARIWIAAGGAPNNTNPLVNSVSIARVG